jgi:hypothetical protein
MKKQTMFQFNQQELQSRRQRGCHEVSPQLIFSLSIVFLNLLSGATL